MALSRYVFLTVLGTPRTKAYVLRPLLDECFPEMLSKPMVSRETSLKKSKKMSCDIQILVWPTRDDTWLRKVVSRLRETTIFALSHLGQLWEALAELRGAWGSFRSDWRSSGRALEGFIYRQTPDQPHSGRYVILLIYSWILLRRGCILLIYSKYVVYAVYDASG